jgi:hypothetical protein
MESRKHLIIPLCGFLVMLDFMKILIDPSQIGSRDGILLFFNLYWDFGVACREVTVLSSIPQGNDV